MDYQDIWNEFQLSLSKAICEVEREYMFLPRMFANSVMRERLYCYELYHQIRCQFNHPPYLLHGEIDKRGQDFIRERFGYDPNPDFVLHRPSSMENIVVIEVKNSETSLEDAQRDIEKLTTFIEDIEYRHGIFLVFGFNDPKLNLGIDNQHITYLLHDEPGKFPKVLYKGDWELITD